MNFRRLLPLHFVFRPPPRAVLALLCGLFAAVGARAQSNYATPYTFTTLAGFPGATGSTNGVGSGARFNQPNGITVDTSGTVYVVDSSNQTIRKITAAGSVTTLAGLAGNLGTADGTGAARFFFPYGIAVDGTGTVYVADTDNSTVRRITPAGAVTTLAGLALSFGSADGTGSSARFNYPYGAAVDNSGNVYVADNHNHTIRKITPTGVVTTLAGLAGSAGSTDGVGSNARFSFPANVAVDASGNVYVADTSNGTIRKITSAGVVTTLAGLAGSVGSTDGTGSGARFFEPAAVAVDAAGNVFVAESQGNTIRKITSAGVVTTLAGSPGSAGSTDGTGSAARFNGPQGIAVDSTGNLYVADTNDSTIRVGSLPASPVPAIVTQPASVTAVIGATVSFTVSASGNPPLSYQWKKNATAIPTGTAATLNLTNVQSSDAASYTVVVTNASGTATSSAATLTIGPPVSGTIDFDSLNALNADVTGTTVINYLGLFGITVTGQTAGTQLAVIDDRFYYGGGSMTAPSGHNVFSQTGLNAPVSFTLNFPQPLASLAFTRAKLIPLTSSGVTHPQWSATALDASGHTLGTVSEGYTSSFVIVPAKTFTLAFTGIAAVRFDANGFGTAGAPAALLDDFVLNYPLAAPVITAQPANSAVASGATATLSVTVTGNPLPTYQWRFNGTTVTGATSASLTLTNVQPATTGLYTALIANSSGNLTSDAAILGVASSSKVVGTGVEIATDVYVAANNNTYDQVLPTGAALTVTADPGQITRTSFIDLTDDIVQVEFSGAGALSIVLDNPSGPAAPLNYNQAISYMKGHAGLVITGANETTNVAVFSVGRFTAFDPTGAFNSALPISATNDPANNGSPLFAGKSATVYDGLADLAFIAIASTNGKFGGVRTANGSYYAAKGFTGIYAPGVQFTGPVYIGDINASLFGTATPVILLGSASDTRITGGDLLQGNAQPVKVSGITQLKFTAGTNSQGVTLPAQTNKAQLLQNGADVTAQIVVNPSL